jgi:hypothetical protein
MAKRVAYGLPCANANIYEDTNPNCIWAWTVINLSLLPSLNLERPKITAFQTKIKSLSLLIKKIKESKSNNDILKIIKAHDSYMDYVRKEKNAFIQKNEHLNYKGSQYQEEKPMEIKQTTRSPIKKVKLLSPVKCAQDDLSSLESPHKKIKEKESDGKLQLSLFQFIPRQNKPDAKYAVNKLDIHQFDNIILKLSSQGQIMHQKIQYTFTQNRIKYISFFDHRVYTGSFRTNKYSITPYNPFTKDPKINYDMETDEEYAELTGESIHDEEIENEVENDNLSEGSQHFLVPDGYLSESERSKDSLHSTNKVDSQNINKIGKEEFISFTKRDNISEHYHAVGLKSKLPIKIIKKQNKSKRQDNFKVAIDYNSCNYTTDLAKMVHGSYFSSKVLADHFKLLHSNITKKHLIKKISQMINKRINFVRLINRASAL